MTRHFLRAASVVLDTSEELVPITYVMEGDTNPGKLVIADTTAWPGTPAGHGRQPCRESRSLPRPAGAPSG